MIESKDSDHYRGRSFIIRVLDKLELFGNLKFVHLSFTSVH